MEITKEGILSELNNMKSALESSLTEKADATVKNVDEKLSYVNNAIEELKSKKPEVSVEEFKSVQGKLEATIAGLDILQTRIKTDSPKKSKTWNSAIAETLDSQKSSIVNISKEKSAKFQLKDVADMQTNTTLDGNIPNTYAPGIVPTPFEMVHARNLFSVTPSETDSYHFYQHVVGEGGIYFQTNEGSAKSQFDEDLVETTVNLNYLAGFLKISRKMLRNFMALRSYISRWLPEKYYQAEDSQVMDAIQNGANGETGSGSDALEIIIKTIGAQKQAKYNVNAIVVDGNTWAMLLTTKAATSGEYQTPIGSVSISPAGQILICGVPVYTASWIVSGHALVCDTNYFTIVQSEGLSLQFFEQDTDNVQKNKITARIEASVGFALLDPKAFSLVAVD